MLFVDEGGKVLRKHEERGLVLRKYLYIEPFFDQGDRSFLTEITAQAYSLPVWFTLSSLAAIFTSSPISEAANV